MTKSLPKTDEGDEFIQFRGPQTSVTHDATGVRFTCTSRNGRRVHRPVRVVDPDEDVSDVDDPVVARPVAEYLVENNPLVCWGVVCEDTDDGDVCGRTFSTPKSLNSHLSVHADSDPDDGGDDGGD